MNNILKNIHILFWGMIPIFLGYGFIFFDDLIEISVYSTILIFATIYYMFFLSFLTIINGVSYYLTRKYNKDRLNIILRIVNLILLIISALCIAFMPDYPDYNGVLSNDFNADRSIFMHQVLTLISILSVILSQLIFILDMIIIGFNKVKEKLILKS